MEHRAQNDFVAEISEARQRRFDHDRLADLERGFASPKLVLPRNRDRNHAVTREAVRRGELGVDMPLPVGPQGRVPKSAGEEIFPQPFQRRWPALGVADQVTFVREIGFVRVFL